MESTTWSGDTAARAAAVRADETKNGREKPPAAAAAAAKFEAALAAGAGWKADTALGNIAPIPTSVHRRRLLLTWKLHALGVILRSSSRRTLSFLARR
jgi:hypothetical protein